MVCAGTATLQQAHDSLQTWLCCDIFCVLQWQAVCSGGWPFQQLAEQLVLDVLDPLWEVRHGAAIALREVSGTGTVPMITAKGISL